MITVVEGRLRSWRLAGVIYEGPSTSADPNEAIPGFEIIRTRRADFIKPNGTLDTPFVVFSRRDQQATIRTPVHSDARSHASSLRDVKQDNSNNEVATSCGGEQIDDILDGLVGAVVGDFESAVWAILRIRTAVEAAVGKWSAQPLVEEQK